MVALSDDGCTGAVQLISTLPPQMIEGAKNAGLQQKLAHAAQHEKAVR